MASGSRPKSKHGRGRGRSRKRRPATGAADVLDPSADGELQDATSAARQTADKLSARAAREEMRKNKKAGAARAHARAREDGLLAGTRPAGERPPAPWHPWPLSELLILVGTVGAVIGLARLGHGGISSGGPVLFAGLGAVAIGTFEVAWREHRTGYRSHALLLALLPVIVFHTVVILGLAAVTTVPRIVNFALLVVDVAVFAVLFKLLRAGFGDARARVRR